MDVFWNVEPKYVSMGRNGILWSRKLDILSPGTISQHAKCASSSERLDDSTPPMPPSPGDCVEATSHGLAAITTSWALSGRWPTLYSARPATLTDGRTDGRTSMTGSETGGWSGGRKKTKDTAREYFTSGMNLRSRPPGYERLETGRREKEGGKKEPWV